MHVFRDPSTKLLGIGALSTDRMFETPTHQEVLAELSRALAGAPGFSALTGEAGLGKTTLVRQAVMGWPGAVQTVVDAAGVSETLAKPNRPARPRVPGILVVENAHDLPLAALEQLGGLDPRTMPHVILVGHSTLWGRLQTNALTPLRDRINTRCVLFPLSYGEAERYVGHLLRLAGAADGQILNDRDRHAMLLAAQGNIRRINAELLAQLASRPTHSERRSPGGLRPARRPGSAGRRGPRALVTAAGVVATLGGILFAAVPDLTALLPSVFSEPALPHAPPVAVQPVAMQPGAAQPVPVAPQLAAVATAEPASQPAAEADGSIEPASSAVPAPPELRAEIPAELPVAGGAEPVAKPGATPAMPDEVVAILIRRGEAMMELHDLSAARQFFERAALEGSGSLRARGALNLAASYDPGEGGPGAWVQDGDAGVALAWYRLAASLGQPEAAAAVRRLAGHTP